MAKPCTNLPRSSACNISAEIQLYDDDDDDVGDGDDDDSNNNMIFAQFSLCLPNSNAMKTYKVKGKGKVVPVLN
jgi:hypothetical protein